MTIKVFMTPSPNKCKGINGIEQVVLHYAKYMPEFGIEYVDNVKDCDVIANHAGTGQVIDGFPFVSHCHGIYWSSDYDDTQHWQYKANANVINSIRKADEVTVPSYWVAETFQRDMRFNPHVIGHAIEFDQWEPSQNQGYVLWNKNRSGDVCYTQPIDELARMYPSVLFAATFAPKSSTPNVNEIGTMPHDEMKEWIQGANVYLSSTKETFGIGILEAMASGVPILGFDFGGNSEIVDHGLNGYLAQPDDYEDLAYGLGYCLQYRDTLGANAREKAKQYNWRDVCEKVAKVYQLALNQQEPTASIVIPIYNKKEHEIKRAIQSAISQTYDKLEHIIVVDDGSENAKDVKEAVSGFDDSRIEFVRQNNQGVANARNNGIKKVDSKYITCLDSDDELQETFLEKLIPHLEQDKALGVAYSALSIRLHDNSAYKSGWPSECDFDAQLEKKNQVPTCCVFRRKAWARLGGYKQRYAPTGCGAEDAEFWLRLGAYGWGIKQVTTKPLFLYSLGGQTMQKGYEEADWTFWHPWVKDKQHPFASIATPSRLSHPVRQYDKPIVSVVIPVGKGHEKDVVNALDSLEAQTLRQWEAIVIEDGADIPDDTKTAYPYVKWQKEQKKAKGAGWARNFGVEKARAPFIVFLDADDWLYPEYLERCIDAWEDTESIIYTDYVGKAFISPEHAQKLLDHDRLKAYDEKSGEAVIAHKSAEYDCELAQQQPRPTGDPNMPFYHWSLVTCLIPREWHNEIGGFDESMPTWEDIDYHWRMARAAKCYYRLQSELVVYNFHTGQRREKSHEMFQEIIEYIKEKYEREEEIMPCVGCSQKVQRNSPNRTYNMYASGITSKADQLRMLEKDAMYVWCTYVAQPNNRGDHPIVGHITQTRYGYGHYGARVLVHRNDIFDHNGNLFGRFEPQPEKPKQPKKIKRLPQPKRETKPPQPIVKKPKKTTFADLKKIAQDDAQLVEPNELDSLDVIPKKTKTQLEEKGITSLEKMRQLTREEWIALDQVGPARAKAIMETLEEKEESEELIKNEFVDLQTIPGITSGLAKQLGGRDISTIDALWDFGIEGFASLNGCDNDKAEMIMSAIQDRFRK